MCKIVLFQTIQFSLSTQFSSIWPLDRTLSGPPTPGQSRPGRDGNEEVLQIPQSSSITGTSPSDSFIFLTYTNEIFISFTHKNLCIFFHYNFKFIKILIKTLPK